MTQKVLRVLDHKLHIFPALGRIDHMCRRGRICGVWNFLEKNLNLNFSMISLVPSFAKNSDFTSPKDLKDQLPITWDLLQCFVQKVFLFSFSWNGGRICVLEDAYASSIFNLISWKYILIQFLKLKKYSIFCNFHENIPIAKIVKFLENIFSTDFGQ